MLKKNSIVLVIYMLFMAMGLYISYKVLGVDYNSSNFSKTFLPFTFLLALFALSYGLKHRKELALDNEGKKNYLPFAIAFITIVAFGIFFLINNFALNIAFFILLVDTALTAIAEETIYRGIVLGGLVKKISTISALLCSAVLFSLLHLLNLLAGLSINEVINQMGSTFIMGMFLGALYLESKNIFLPILFHWMWNFIILSNGLSTIDFMPIVLLLVIGGEIFAIIYFLLKQLRRKI
ncbi:CPBP family intramembrane metalloprotease [Anaerococcus sp. AGMB00486]|uniref:CPBP family intramembrane metalloprotease n=2 Tax=Anaerococcus TaxID=165779 RepID=A0ABX2N7V7_9FIRM|nr:MULTISPECIES: CPBP family intramembrane glutamic endopeptidase [Anaerococcus]MSS78344.1 CPBP family intramembrane metalloprotease [Anaerococcus porci]NVF10750.1 CPBP family intramembrane metalloprotease [Anaerococcus faecalis]